MGYRGIVGVFDGDIVGACLKSAGPGGNSATSETRSRSCLSTSLSTTAAAPGHWVCALMVVVPHHYLAKLVQITPVSLWFMILITIVWLVVSNMFFFP